MALTLHDFCLKVWEPVLAKARRAVVFLDTPCAEILHWCGGAELLLNSGAVDVKEFSSFESGTNSQPKALFVVSSPLRGRVMDVVRDVVSQSAFQYCVLVTAVSPGESEGRASHEQLEERLCEWMGNMNYTAEVMWAPLLLAPLAPHLLTAPAYSSLFPLLTPEDLQTLNWSRPEKKRFAGLGDVDLPSLTPELQLQIKNLVSGLNYLMEGIGVREECFSVGHMSRIIAGELASYPQAKNRRKASQSKASLVFIDRTLDLTGSVGHHGDSLVEKIVSVLPCIPGHSNDVMVNMEELTGLRSEAENEGIIAPGCLAQPNDSAAKALWESILNMKQKEAVMEVRRHLVEAASREKLPIKMSMGRVTPEQLRSHIQLFKGNGQALESHCGLLQLALATVQTLKHPQYSKWDNFLAFERHVLQSTGKSELPTVLNQLYPMIKSHNERTNDDYSVEEIIIILIYIYSVTGNIEINKELEVIENQIKKSLVQSFCDEPELSTLLQKITECETSPELTLEKSRSAVEKIFVSLREIAKTRANLKQLHSVYIPGSNIQQASYKPLLKQIVEEIFHPDRTEPVDIEHMSSGLTDLLKTGFSMFMKVSRPHPGDSSLLILFVIGGVTVSEVRMVKDLVSTLKPGVQVIVLSTRLLKPIDIPELLFATDRLHPDIGI
ncbi:sec1 family domain-containing protein 2 isoform X2 [Bombina bombina]|uniref:sec1 family domain-containing protein 2 isoform X2 n=1 Tax=Bombina bombina TaxID=8345 RepID=UPI00235A8A6C|nr:sec1 family domain-containing protein 2 isoform X2 [Bombina bombina]